MSAGPSMRDLLRRVGPKWDAWNRKRGGQYRWVGDGSDWRRDRAKRKPKEAK